MPVFSETDILLQSEKPCTDILKPTLEDSLKMVKFVKPAVLTALFYNITKVVYHKLKKVRG